MGRRAPFFRPGKGCKLGTWNLGVELPFLEACHEDLRLQLTRFCVSLRIQH